MEIESANGYGIAISDLEGNWDNAFKVRLRKESQKLVFGYLSFFQKIKLLFLFTMERNRASKLDLSDIKARGMNNSAFIKQQLDYIAMFSALSTLVGKDKALEIMYRVMEETSVEAFSQSSPEHTAILEYGNAMEFFRKYMEPLPEACERAGCLEMVRSENKENSFQFDIHWCVWLELAKKMSIPEACLPNCYADDYAYPAYFEKYGIKYSRKGTLAQGSKCCDLRFEKEV